MNSDPYSIFNLTKDSILGTPPTPEQRVEWDKADEAHRTAWAFAEESLNAFAEGEISQAYLYDLFEGLSKAAKAQGGWSCGDTLFGYGFRRSREIIPKDMGKRGPKGHPFFIKKFVRMQCKAIRNIGGFKVLKEGEDGSMYEELSQWLKTRVGLELSASSIRNIYEAP